MKLTMGVSSQASASRRPQAKWTEVFETDMSERALQVANMLDAIGLEVNIQYDKTDNTHPISHVWVREAQTGREKQLLTAYGLTA
jgi:hypothetical protein